MSSMSSRLLSCLFAATALVAVACDDSTGLDDDEAANVRVVHASTVGTTPTGAIDVALNGNVGAGNAAIDYGEVSPCIRVNASNPELDVRLASNSQVIGSPASFTAGGRNTVILSGPPTNVRVTTIEDPWTAPVQAGRSRVRVFNGTTRTTPLDVTITPFGGTATTDAGVAQATASDWFDVPAGAAVITLRNQGGTTNVATLNIGAGSGEEQTWIVVDPATTNEPLRWIWTEPCAPAND